jgi:hypothetical protein
MIYLNIRDPEEKEVKELNLCMWVMRGGYVHIFREIQCLVYEKCMHLLKSR